MGRCDACQLLPGARGATIACPAQSYAHYQNSLHTANTHWSPCFPRKMALYKPGSSSKQVPRPSGVTEFEILKASHKYVSKRPEPNHIIILSFFENIDSCERTKMIVNFHGMINLQRNIIQVSIVSSQFATSSITNQARWVIVESSIN